MLHSVTNIGLFLKRALRAAHDGSYTLQAGKLRSLNRIQFHYSTYCVVVNLVTVAALHFREDIVVLDPA